MNIKLKTYEKDTQKTIIDWLTVKKIFHYKNNTVGIYKQSTGQYIPSPSKGAPDIVAVIQGKYIGIEVKAPNGKQSENQVAFQSNLENAGGLYILAFSVGDVIDKIAQYQKVINTLTVNRE